MQFIFFSLFLIFLVVAIISIYSFWIGAPIFFSPKRKLRQVLKYVNLPEGSNFYDLGAGTGRTMIIAQKEFNMKVSGFELASPLYILAKINMFFRGVKNELYMRNFYNKDLSNADVVYCFLTPPAMKKLRPKFENELKKGTVVISYAFEIDGWKAENVIFDGRLGKMFVYRT